MLQNECERLKVLQTRHQIYSGTIVGIHGVRPLKDFDPFYIWKTN